MGARLASSVPVLAVAALVGACAGPAGTACTLIGAEPGVDIGYGQVLRHTSGHPVTVRACVQSACEAIDVTPGQPAYPFRVGRAVVARHQDAPVRVRVTIRGHRGHLVFAGQTTVRPHQVQPNGPSCPPTVWVGRVVASGDHTLTAAPGPAHGR